MNNNNSDHRKKRNKALTYLRNVYTSLLAALSAFVFSSFVISSYLAMFFEYQSEFSYPVNAVLITLLPIITVAIVAIAYDYFDNVDLFNKREYFESGSKRLLIARPQYIVSFALPVILAVPLFSSSIHAALTFYFPAINIAVARLLSIAVMTVMRLWQLWSLQDKWQSEIDNPLFTEKAMFKRNRDMYAFKPYQIILQPLGYFVAFGLLFAFVGNVIIPTIIFTVIVTLLNFILSPELLWSVFAIPFLIVAAILIFHIIYNATKRLILLKKLKRIEKEGLGRVELNGSKIFSATFIFIPFSVKITDREGVVYSCAVAASGEINTPIFFKKDEYIIEHGFHLRGGALLSKGGTFAQAVDISQLGGKENPTNLVLGFRTSHKIKFPEGEGRKVVILNPTPTTAYAVKEREFKSIDNGEEISDYTIFTATGLFNHIERQSRKGKHDYDY